MAYPLEELEEVAELYELYGRKQIEVVRALSKKWKRTSVQGRLQKAALIGLIPPPGVLPGFEVTSVSEGPRGTTTVRKPERGEEFKVPEGHAIKGVSALVGPDGRVSQQWIKTKEGELSLETITDRIKEAFAELPQKEIEPFLAQDCDDDTATVIPLADLHLGLLAWGKEAGENFDLKIAETTVKETLRRLFATTPNSKTAVLLGLGDLLHFDGYEPVTSRSRNVLDVDGRYPLVLQTAASIIIWAVECLSEKHEVVKVRVLPGNHDDQSAIAISLALSMYYREVERVEVDTDPSRFWWWRFGDTFLGATHGDQAKMNELPLIMATVRPEDWGASKHRYLYTGHIHHKSAIKEVGNVIVESFRSPAARDAWHAASGYVSGRSMSAITLHKKYGEISRQTANIVV